MMTELHQCVSSYTDLRKTKTKRGEIGRSFVMNSKLGRNLAVVPRQGHFMKDQYKDLLYV